MRAAKRLYRTNSPHLNIIQTGRLPVHDTKKEAPDLALSGLRDLLVKEI